MAPAWHIGNFSGVLDEARVHTLVRGCNVIAEQFNADLRISIKFSPAVIPRQLQVALIMSKAYQTEPGAKDMFVHGRDRVPLRSGFGRHVGKVRRKSFRRWCASRGCSAGCEGSQIQQDLTGADSPCQVMDCVPYLGGSPRVSQSIRERPNQCPEVPAAPPLIRQYGAGLQGHVAKAPQE